MLNLRGIFQYRKSHKLTCRPPDGTIVNQIDHVAISRRWRSTFQDTRMKRSADETVGWKERKSTRNKCCTSKLREQNVKDDFVIALANRYEVL